MVVVKLLGIISNAARGQNELKISANTLEGTLEGLKRTFGNEFTELVFDGYGNIRPFVNIFINKKHESELQGLKTKIAEEDEVLIVPAVVGG